jgi:ParB family chromosome partitioning protein
MSKRSDTIRSLFAQPTSAPALSADNNIEPTPRVAAGAVRSMRETFSEIERENEDLRARFAGGEQIVEIDADDIDPSPFADRFAQDDESSFEALKLSIAERGQEIPILLRANSAKPGRYEIAYGHRRVRAARALGRPVRAVVRALDDDQLVIAQGIENAAREDLTFIERAVFAARLETSGRSRAVIQQALVIDRAEASKLISVAKAVPEDLIRAIGKAERVGRGRWQELAEALRGPGAIERVLGAAASEGFAKLASEARFARVLSAAKNAKEVVQTKPFVEIRDTAGAVIGQIRASGHELKVTLSKHAGGAFASFLVERFPSLLHEFRASEAGDGPSKDS